MRRILTVTATGLLVTSVLVGCAAPEADDASPLQSPGSTGTTTLLTSVTNAVLADAASRTGLDQASLAVENAQAVTWSDGSLGCPQPGLSYTQARIPGFRISVRAGTRRLDYHASRAGTFLLCPEGRSVDPAGTDDT